MALRSALDRHPLNAADCRRVFYNLAGDETGTLESKIESLQTFVNAISAEQILSPVDAVEFTDVADFRGNLSYVSWCMRCRCRCVLGGSGSSTVVSNSKADPGIQHCC